MQGIAGIETCPDRRAYFERPPAGSSGRHRQRPHDEKKRRRSNHDALITKADDYFDRPITLVGPQGETKTLKVGDQVKNLAQVKPGDTVVARFYDAIAYVVAPAGTKLPENAMAMAEAQAVPGELPAGAVGAKIIVTGLVVGVNPVAHTISLVNPPPAGGEIRTLTVKNPEYQQMLPQIKVGDTITAVISEALVVAVEAAK